MKSIDRFRKLIVVGILAVSVLGNCFESVAQCNVTANATLTDITCGECVTLSHFGSTQGNISFSENFNNGNPT